MMRLVIDAATVKMGGAVTILGGILDGFVNGGGEHRVDVWVPDDVGHRLPQSSSVRVRPIPRLALGRAGRLLWEQTALPLSLKRDRADLLFSLTNALPLSPVVPAILLLHQAFFFPDRGEWRRAIGAVGPTAFAAGRALAAVSAGRATRILVQTDEMRRRVARAFGRRVARKIVRHHFSVAPFGLGEPSRGATLEGIATIDEARARGTAIILVLSMYTPTKNLESVFEVSDRLSRAGQRALFVLTIAEDAEPGAKALVARAREKYAERVVSLGHIERHEIPEVLSRGDLFYYPSSIETYACPLIEAMPVGLPLVVPGVPYAREVCDDAGIYFPDRDFGSASLAIAGLLTNRENRERAREASRRRASHFESRAAHDRLMAILDDALNTSA